MNQGYLLTSNSHVMYVCVSSSNVYLLIFLGRRNDWFLLAEKKENNNFSISRINK